MTDCLYIRYTYFSSFHIYSSRKQRTQMTAVFKLFLKTGIKTRTMYRKATELSNKGNQNVVNCVFLSVNSVFCSIFFFDDNPVSTIVK